MRREQSYGQMLDKAKSKSEVKLPKLVSTNISQDHQADDTMLYGGGYSMTHGGGSSINNSILSSSMVNNHRSHKRFFLDQSIIVEETGKDIAQKMEYINNHELRKLTSPELESDFDLLGFINSKNDKDKSNVPSHMILQDDLKTHLYIEKKAFYAKISTIDKNFPMKVKVTGEEGVYDFFFSFFDPFPNKDKSSEEFPQRKDHLYRFHKPKAFSQWAYICISSKENAKVQLKVWFTDANLEKFRSKDSLKIKPNWAKEAVTLKEKLKIELSEQEKKQLQSDVQEIKHKKLQKLKSVDMQIVNRNKEMAGNVELMQKKKEFDFVLHNIKCEEVIRKSINIQLETYQQRYQKYVNKIIHHRITLQRVARQKMQREINALSAGWLPFFYLVKITEIFQEKINLKKLSEIFKGRQKRAFEDLVRNFKGKKLEMKPYLDDKQRLMNDILMGMNVKAKLISKVKKTMAAKVLCYFVRNQKQNHIMNTISKLSKQYLAQIMLIQKKRKATVALQQFITAKMLDGIIETLKDEDFKRKQFIKDIKENTEISFYSNYLKKRDKQILVKLFLKTMKEKLVHQLRICVGKEEPVTDEDKELLAKEKVIGNKGLELDHLVVKAQEVKAKEEDNSSNNGNIVAGTEDKPSEVKQEGGDKEQPKSQQLVQGESEQPNEQQQGQGEQETPSSKKQVRESRFKLTESDWAILDVIRNTNIRINIIKNRPLLRELILKKLNEIKQERDQGASELYLTQASQQQQSTNMNSSVTK